MLKISLLYLRKAWRGKNWRVKNTRAAGFSILEMTIVLGIMAATSIAGIKVLNGKIEQNAVDRVVADLTLVAEAAYECYVAGFCKTDVGWKSGLGTSGTASAYLSDNQRSFLPRGFSDNYEVQGITATAAEPSKLVIQAVNLPNKRVVQRVAHTFGSLAEVAQAKVGQEKVVKVTLGIPGTESAFSGLKDEIKMEVKKEMKMEDFIFTSSGRNIEGVDYVIAKRIKLGRDDEHVGVDLTADHVKILVNLLELTCDGFLYRIRGTGKFVCRD